MTEAEADAETVRRLREHLARRNGPHGPLPHVHCRWCGSARHYSPECPVRTR